MERLIRRYGGVPMVAPSMREVPLSEKGSAWDFLRRLERREIETAILLTGVGVRGVVTMSCATHPRERLAALLERSTLVTRDTTGVSELRKLGLVPQARVPEPNTWREILSSRDAEAPVGGSRVVVLEHGGQSDELVAGLEQQRR